MSAAASPAPSEEQTKRSEVSYRFCQECSNLLYPKEDKATSTLLYICKACHAMTTHDSACTYRQQLGATVQETAGVTTDVANDPTLPRTSQRCPRCRETDAVYFQSQQRGADTGMKLYYVCTACNHVYTVV
ncbi:putative DNA directed RNA polymerase II 15 kDa subunit [Exophiala viscosa]|uniref:putative DNA directed RNA polymerase II 15 kDa subunit n=1 Tax=Exophiala viscosa TaxID=2486360 RepID=UPI0021954BE1|nr:putative DNA directed RNA polymerase II 15 kDa subunit [Exophiala viscosa]